MPIDDIYTTTMQGNLAWTWRQTYQF
jgi:hypothetical protein